MVGLPVAVTSPVGQGTCPLGRVHLAVDGGSVYPSPHGKNDRQSDARLGRLHDTAGVAPH